VGIQPEDASRFYHKACCYALQRRRTLALADLQQAIEINPSYAAKASTDADFALLHSNPQFRALIEPED
jgi:hypothetical protein